VRYFKQYFTGNLSTLSLRLWEFTGSALVNLFVCFLLLLVLSPLSYMVLTSLKDKTQFLDSKSPIWPAEAETYAYQVKTTPSIRCWRPTAGITGPW
jgi:ABC-type glycerol-3-phosphate transport system permease component